MKKPAAYTFDPVTNEHQMVAEDAAAYEAKKAAEKSHTERFDSLMRIIKFSRLMSKMKITSPEHTSVNK